MKYLKKFENFDFGRFNNDDNDDAQDWIEDVEDVEDEESIDSIEDDEDEDDEETLEDEREMRSKVWGDEVVERKKAKPDFLDIDKDGNKKESLRKAAKDAKKTKGSVKDNDKDLTAAQKRLPEGLRKAIADKREKK